jgi:hypothetical protein
VALSLIFVGLEIRQNTVAQRVQTRQGLADASRDFTLGRAGSGSVRLSIHRGLRSRKRPALGFEGGTG